MFAFTVCVPIGTFIVNAESLSCVTTALSVVGDICVIAALLLKFTIVYNPPTRRALSLLSALSNLTVTTVYFSFVPASLVTSISFTLLANTSAGIS